MKGHTFVILRLALALSVLAVQAGRLSAQSQAPAQPQRAERTTITDSTGRVHRLSGMRKLTPEERKAAAQRAAASRADRTARQQQRQTPKVNPGVKK